MALGGERFAARVGKLVARRRDSGEQPALTALRNTALPSPSEVEAAVEAVFAAAGPARRRRLRLYALRKHSALRASDVARRCGRSHLPAAHTRAQAGTAVALAVRDLDAAAQRDPELARGLRRVARQLGAADR